MKPIKLEFTDKEVTPWAGMALLGKMLHSVDFNVAWTDVPQLSRPAQTLVFGPRLGKNFEFKKPYTSLAVWIGGFRVHLNSDTNGSILLGDVFPGTLGVKIDEGFEKVENAHLKLEAGGMDLVLPNKTIQSTGQNTIRPILLWIRPVNFWLQLMVR